MRICMKLIFISMLYELVSEFTLQIKVSIPLHDVKRRKPKKSRLLDARCERLVCFWGYIRPYSWTCQYSRGKMTPARWPGDVPTRVPVRLGTVFENGDGPPNHCNLIRIFLKQMKDDRPKYPEDWKYRAHQISKLQFSKIYTNNIRIDIHMLHRLKI
jgi:hypothetical protein